MPTDTHFRASTCLTLVLTLAALGYSEWDLVPGVATFTALIAAITVAAFVFDRRLSVGLRFANVLGLGIAGGSLVWLAARIGSQPEGYSQLLVQPGLLLPYVGPFLMMLIPAKLLRPKHAGDWWTLQGIGLAAVALGASMSESVEFAVLLAAYAVSALWSVSLLHARAAAGLVAPAAAGPRVVAWPARFRPWRLARAIVLVAAGTAVLGLPPFLLTPRSTAEKWVFGKPRMETGLTVENTHDINRTGDLSVNHDVALQVTATDADGEPKLDLDPETLWRAVSYSEYVDGKWVRRSYPACIAGGQIRGGRLELNAEPPKLGPGTYQLAFQPIDPAAATVIASPPRWRVGAHSPVRTLGRSQQICWPALYDGSFSPDGFYRRAHEYLQWTRPAEEPGLGEPFELSAGIQFVRANRALTGVGLPAVKEWAAARLRAMARDGRLPAAVVAEADTDDGLRVQPRHYEAVARAFRTMFATSPEFTYTLKLRRQDRRLDLVEDFLFNTHAGHCQWYASAFCLALRSVGVPAQFVMGYKGQEAGPEGVYVVRQENAHAWVEVLVPRKAPAGFEFQDAETGRAGTVWHWLSLDPTPGASDAAAAGSWFDGSSFQSAVASITEYLLKFDGERQKEVAEVAPQRSAEIGAVFAALAAVVLAGRWLVRFARRPRGPRAAPGTPEALPWYRAFAAVLKRHGYERGLGQTPREFAEQVRTALKERYAAVADIPAYVVSKLHRVRYAGLHLTDEELAEVAAATRDLERGLKHPEGTP